MTYCITALPHHFYARPSLLVIDEVGYLSYSNRHADLLFELISRREDAACVEFSGNRTNARDTVAPSRQGPSASRSSAPH
jgi:hypothetical protein